MNDHPTEYVLLQHFDGTLTEAADRDVGRHVAACPECGLRLDQLAAFEGFVARHMPGDAMADADMFEVAERTLAAKGGVGSRRRWWGVFGTAVVALAAAGVALMLWLGSPAGSEHFRLVRYFPEDPARQATAVRFHLELTLQEPAFVAAWVRFADGAVEVLLPDGATSATPPVRGEVRLPLNALLDWEYVAPRVPSEVLVVASSAPLDEPLRRDIGTAWRAASAGAVPAAAAAAGKARVLAMPKNAQ